MVAVVIGVDPAKRSHTIEVIDGSQTTLATARFDNDNDGYRKMRALARGWPARVWAVEGATGVGLQLAQRLVCDGERVLDVPSKLSTRVRAIVDNHPAPSQSAVMSLSRARRRCKRYPHGRYPGRDPRASQNLPTSQHVINHGNHPSARPPRGQPAPQPRQRQPGTGQIVRARARAQM